jgi:hypothetical protein
MALALGVKTRHKDYDKYAPKWKRARDVVAGQDAVHTAGTAYLDLLANEDPVEYLKRVRRTPFFNASFRTVASFVGMLFRKPPTLEVPKQLEPLLEDVTMSGVSFENLAQNCAYEDFTTSWLGIYVDHPTQVQKKDGTPLTLAEAELLGLRPSMTLYGAEAIRNWEYRRINNKRVLSRVRLDEIKTERKSEFETEEVKVIRVLDLEEETNLYRVRVFKEDTEEQIGDDVYPLMNGQRLDFIPFYFIGPDGTDGTLEDPILIDLFDHNIKHYQVSADYEHACHMTALPTPWVTGYQTEMGADGAPVKTEFYIGSTTAWVFPDPNTKVGYLEFEGSGIQAIKENLDGKKEELAALGARALTPEKAGVESQGALIIRNTGEHSILGAAANAISGGLLKALQTFAKWAGIAGEIKFAINRDFIPFNIDPAALTGWMAAVQAGLMSQETFFDLIKRGDLVDQAITFEEEQARIDANPPMPAPVAGGTGEGQDNPDDKPESQPRQGGGSGEE